MRRKLVLGGAVLGLSSLLAPVTDAIGSPPLPPTTYFGTAVGAAPGQSVIALIDSGGISVVCGSGETLAAPGAGTVYRIDVVPDSTRAGCGAPGRQIQFYVVGGSAGPGRLAANLGLWNTADVVQQDLIFGPALGQQRFLPESASDGTY